MLWRCRRQRGCRRGNVGGLRKGTAACASLGGLHQRAGLAASRTAPVVPRPACASPQANGQPTSTATSLLASRHGLLQRAPSSLKKQAAPTDRRELAPPPAGVRSSSAGLSSSTIQQSVPATFSSNPTYRPLRPLSRSPTRAWPGRAQCIGPGRPVGWHNTDILALNQCQQ